jgi:flagellin
MTVINTNIAAIVANNALRSNQRDLDKAMQQLATGKKVNSAADNAAAVSIADNMTSYIRGLDQAVRNANDAISLLQTADGAMVEQSALLQRMREIAVQAVSDTYTATQRDYMDLEYQALEAEVDRIGAQTEWNGTAILDDTGGVASDGVFVFQVGASATQTFGVSIGDISTTTALVAIAAGDVDTQANAATAITNLDTAIAAVAAQRATIGAGINRLQHAIENLTMISQETSASRSQVQDTDYAEATAALARAQVIQQAGTAMLAQANQQPSSVLYLLRS